MTMKPSCSNVPWANCSIEGISTIAFDVQFSPDPITKPGKDVTTFTANGGIIRSNGTSQGSSHGDVFSKYALIHVDYVSSIEGGHKASFKFPVPSGNKDFSMQFHIATPFSTLQNHILKFNLWDMDEHIGCVRFVRNAFQN
ncbi:hypothetical protein C2G38_2243920 [Gigaspora rosea]|uniref:MD-2-related lipid-recognition domain-containing protein n=1 Tax=Gigaspora rosea TaxID=44941 RepID=A0A397VG71_9GLOM|nr:hypothetical protein C2G38_2243920 [Gigaspora rosea]